MRLTTSGKPKNIDKALCKKAINWYAKKLWTPKGEQDIVLHVEFSADDMPKGMNGFCDSYECGVKLR